ncbi:hypothetical protein ACFL6C_13040 [Myxococcota bacterium]
MCRAQTCEPMFELFSSNYSKCNGAFLDESRFVLGTTAADLVIFDAATGVARDHLVQSTTRGGAVTAVARCPLTGLVAHSRGQGSSLEVTVTDPKSGKAVARFAGNWSEDSERWPEGWGTVFGLAFTDDGTALIANHQDCDASDIVILDIAAAEIKRRIHRAGGNNGKITIAGDLLAIGTDDGAVVHNLQTDETMTLGEESVSDVAVSSNRRSLLTAGHVDLIEEWELRSGKLIERHAMPDSDEIVVDGVVSAVVVDGKTRGWAAHENGTLWSFSLQIG